MEPQEMLDELNKRLDSLNEKEEKEIELLEEKRKLLVERLAQLDEYSRKYCPLMEALRNIRDKYDFLVQMESRRVASMDTNKYTDVFTSFSNGNNFFKIRCKYNTSHCYEESFKWLRDLLEKSIITKGTESSVNTNIVRVMELPFTVEKQIDELAYCITKNVCSYLSAKDAALKGLIEQTYKSIKNMQMEVPQDDGTVIVNVNGKKYRGHLIEG